MSWAADTQWEVRPDGSNNNGIGFSPSFGGTDYSQQASPQVSVTDGVTNGTTTVTSATANFTAPMVGNGIRIALDNDYQITAVVSATQITVDRATANGGAGRTMKVGGAGGMDGGAVSCLAMFDLAVIQPGNTVWIKATNASGVLTAYTPSNTFGNIQGSGTQFGGSEFNLIRVEGYTSIRGDGGRATVTISNGGGGGYQDLNFGNFAGVLKNFRFNGQSGTGSRLLLGFQSGGPQFFENIIVDNHLAAAGTSAVQGGNALLYRRCWFIGQASASSTFRDVGNISRFENCRFDAGTGALNYSVEAANSNAPTFLGCIFNGGTYGIQINQNSPAFRLIGCIVWGCSINGIDIPTTSLHDDNNLLVESCIIGKNTTYDVRRQTSVTGNAGSQAWVNHAFRCNWFYTTGTARYSGIPAAADDGVLTANPFNSDTTGDFSLNAASGGGALIVATPCKESFPDGLNTASILAGYYGSAASVSTDAASMRSLWREYTNQRNTTVVPDTVVDMYLDSGLQEINRQVRYYLLTDSTSIVLVAGTQEYTLPENVVELQWVQWSNQRNLEKGDIEQWRRRADDWRNEAAGVPQYWAHYGNILVVRPTPSSAAVASSSQVTFRYYGVPPSLDTSGPVQTDISMQRLAVFYGVWQWSLAYPDSAVAQQRGAGFKAMFDEGMVRVVEYYSRRGISR